MTDHSRLSPSNANRWVRCPGAVTACELEQPGLPSDQTAAEEGTAAHYVAECALRDKQPGETAPNGLVIDQTMKDGAELYRNTVMADARKHHVAGGEFWGVETLVECLAIHPECFGTPDMWFFDTTTLTLFIYDYKYGKRAVEVVDNLQLIIYASGLIDVLERAGYGAAKITIVLCIVQPRAYHQAGPVRRQTTTFGALWSTISTIIDSAAEALGPNPRCKAGRHCYRCARRLNCKVNRDLTGSICDYLDAVNTDSMTTLDIASEWVFLTRAKKMLEDRLTASTAHLEYAFHNGEELGPVAGRRGTGRQRWTADPSVVAGVALLNGVNVNKPQELITPKQAIAAGLPAEVVNSPQFTTRDPGSLNLTEADASLIFKGSN